jgi:molybdate-binding protein
MGQTQTRKILRSMRSISTTSANVWLDFSALRAKTYDIIVLTPHIPKLRVRKVKNLLKSNATEEPEEVRLTLKIKVLC